MIDLAESKDAAVRSVSCSAALRRSTFEQRRIAEAALEERMLAQREARLQALHARIPAAAGGPLANARFPHRWTDE
jgi:hypothetical protein